MRLVRAAVAVGVLALLGLLVWDVVHGRGGGVAQKVDKGKVVPAPALDLPRLDGQGRLNLASLHGKVVVVNFWQSDCLPASRRRRRSTPPLARGARRASCSSGSTRSTSKVRRAPT